MDWGRLFSAANAGDPLAIDHLIDARLKGELPHNDAQTFEESCFMYWIKDSVFTQEAKMNAALHDSQESDHLNRDKNATCIQLRFIEAAHMSRLLGLGLNGNWDISVTFHPHSHLKIRVHMVEEAPAAGQADMHARSRAWQRAGFKLVREWKRTRVASVRQFASLRLMRPSLDARNVTYSILCATKTATSNNDRSASSALRIDASLSEVVEDQSKVFRVSVSAICSASNGGTGKVNHTGQLDLYGGSFCSLADWNSTDMSDSVDAQHGGTTFRCTRSEELQSAAEISEMSIGTVWLLQSTGMHTFRASVRHELENSSLPRKGKLLSRVSRLFRDSGSAAAVMSLSNALSVYVTCDLSFADFLTKLGVMRRVRDQAIRPNQGIQRIGASARF